ncbi:MAG: GMC family oxidoreductase [Atopobiaceae bacterium]|nr:GMC family oxidoreductase [Atopobiaceae bacterium]
MTKAIVVGSGAGGCMAAKELAACGMDVTVLETGRAFRPFKWNLDKLEPARQAGLFFDERMISLLFPEMRIEKAQDGLVHVTGRAVGGTTTLATGNALRYDRYLAGVGINLDAEFAELEHEVPQTTEHRAGWSELTERLFSAFEDLGLEPQITPKFMNDASRCVQCGMCVLGCKFGAKWTADELISDVEGVTMVAGATVEKVAIENGRATGVVVSRGAGARRKLAQADLVVLAAGGLGTPVILEASGIPASPTLFVDPVLCVAAHMEGAGLEHQLPMPFVSEQPDYILSPYFDWLSFYFNKGWRMPHGDIISIMIKMADASVGSYDGKHLDKPLLDSDWETIARAVDKSYEVLEAIGVPREETFFGTLNAGHPGGCFPLTEAEAETLHHEVLPPNLYLADASLLPRSMGNPPMLTIMALAKRVARLAANA